VPKSTKTTKPTEEKKEPAPKAPKEGFERKKDGTIEVTVVIPWKEAQKAQTEIEESLIKEVQIAGFRKGQAPKNIAKQRLNPELVKEEVLKKVVGKAYNEAIEKYKLTPIISPQIHIEVFTEGTDIVFTAETCEEPEVKLNNYKEEIKSLKAKKKIVTSVKDAEKEVKEASLDEVIDTAMKVVEITVPNVLIENEISRLLSQMLDELKKLGLTLDQYLSSRNLDPEKLREEYKAKAIQDLKLEFFLRKVADEEKITVEKEDIEKALGTIENPQEREEVMKNPYLVASIIRQQKTITFLGQI
jgi:FKBP-type peptidyl-prolyl cis-trans isomerase (trigger factor)